MGNAAWQRFAEAMNKVPRRVEAEGKIRWYEDGVLVREVDAATYWEERLRHEIVEVKPIEIPRKFLLGSE